MSLPGAQSQSQSQRSGRWAVDASGGSFLARNSFSDIKGNSVLK